MAKREPIETKTERRDKLDEAKCLLYGEIKAARKQLFFITVPREFIGYTGSLDAAVFLAQLLHWTPRARRKDGFIFKTFDEWKVETGLSEHKVKKAVKLLEALRVMEAKKMMAASKDHNASNTWHYRLKLQEFWDSFRAYLEQPEDVQVEPVLDEKDTRTEKTSGSITKHTYKKALKEKYRKTAIEKKEEELNSFEDEIVFDDAEDPIDERRQSQNFGGQIFEKSMHAEIQNELQERRIAKQRLAERINRLPADWRWAFKGEKWDEGWEAELCAVEKELEENRRIRYAERV